MHDVTRQADGVAAARRVAPAPPTLQIAGDAHPGAPIHFDGDVEVRGSLIEGRTIDVTGSLTADGAIEAVRLTVGGAASVKGGIVGKSIGHYRVGGNLRCRFISGGQFIVAGNVQVVGEVTNTQLACAGRITVVQGPISGGVVGANGGVACQVLGNPRGTQTIVEAGDSVLARSFSQTGDPKIQANRKRVAEVREKIAPLLRLMKQLTAQQRERATELLYEAEELEAQTQAMVDEQEARRRQWRDSANPEIIISEALHPGVTMRLCGCETTIATAFKGPLTIAFRAAGAAGEIVLTDSTDQSKTVLPSHPVESQPAA